MFLCSSINHPPKAFYTDLFSDVDMAMRIGGIRRKSRQKMRKAVRTKGKISISAFFQSFKEGEKVLLGVEPAVQNGFYHPNYMGKSGIISGKKGRCYEVTIKDMGKEKTLIVHPVHLKRKE